MKYYQKRTMKIILAFIIAIIFFSIFASPQICREAYMLQAYVLRKNGGDFLRTPDNYNGEWIDYYSNGQIANKRLYNAGRLIGTMEKYDTYGRLREKQPFIDGLKTGEYLEFWVDGSILTRGTFSSGLRHGIWFHYDETGKIIQQASYNYGKLISGTSFSPSDLEIQTVTHTNEPYRIIINDNVIPKTSTDSKPENPTTGSSKSEPAGDRAETKK